jgi:hypothetical protein
MEKSIPDVLRPIAKSESAFCNGLFTATINLKRIKIHTIYSKYIHLLCVQKQKNKT